MAVIIGTTGDDSLDGTPGADVIRLLAGDDLGSGLGGPDRIYGQAGNDTLLGGEGNDILRGQNDEDVLDGGTGDDALYGGRQRDTVAGGDGNDLLQGGGRGDVLDGGAGDDTLIGWHGPDTLLGGEGVDAALYLGPAEGYLIEEIEGQFRITDLDAGDGLQEGSDWLEDVERAVFGDGTVVDLDAGGGEAIFELADLDGTNGFVINGVAESDLSGWSVSGAGDVNGDGIDDIVVAGRSRYYGEASSSYVVFGSTAGFTGSLELADLNGSDGFAINGVTTVHTGTVADNGWSVSTAGDINGDGIDDLIIGNANGGPLDPYGTPTGASHVVFGSAAGFGAALELASLDGTNGFSISGAGYCVSDAGDVNGDGVADVVIGGSRDVGGSYVVFGSAAGFDASVELADLDSNDGFRIDFAAYSVSALGDINGDGIDDLALGQPYAGPEDYYGNRAGEICVVFGSSTGFGAILEHRSLDGSDGFLFGANEYAPVASVSNAGDVNGDGIDDMVVGVASISSDYGSTDYAGYVVFGSSEGFSARLDPAALDGSDGFRILTSFGTYSDFQPRTSVSGLGDINGDGIDDIIIGAAEVERSYVIFGSGSGFGDAVRVDDLDGSNGFAIEAVAEGDQAGFSVSGAGDVNGDGIDDMLICAPGAGPRDESGYSLGYGAAYVVFGSTTGFGASLDVAALLASGGAVTADDGLLL